LLWATWLYNRQKILSKYDIDFYRICTPYSSEHINLGKPWHGHYSLSTYQCLMLCPYYVNNVCILNVNRFTDDKQTYDIDTQFLWGSALMINPVLKEVRHQFILLFT